MLANEAIVDPDLGEVGARLEPDRLERKEDHGQQRDAPSVHDHPAEREGTRVGRALREGGIWFAVVGLGSDQFFDGVFELGGHAGERRPALGRLSCPAPCAGPGRAASGPGTPHRPAAEHAHRPTSASPSSKTRANTSA